MWTWIKNWLWRSKPAQPEPHRIAEAKKPGPPIWLFIVPGTGARPPMAAPDIQAATAPAKPEPAPAVDPSIDRLFARRLASVHKLNTPASRTRNRRSLTPGPARPRPVPVAQTIKRQPPAHAPRFARPQARAYPAPLVLDVPAAQSPVAAVVHLKAA